MNLTKAALKASTLLALVVLSACGGGGGGGGSSSGGGSSNPPVDSSDIVRYPYETVYGDACRSSSEPTPGCTFVRSTGQRVTVSADPVYNSQGYGSDDMWYVKFDASGKASVYNDLGQFQYYADASKFAGYISGSTIGVGTTGAYWENVAGKQYWFGKNGVLYSANTGAANYGQAINNKDANKSGDSDSFALKSSANVAIIKAGAQKLVKEYGFTASKAVAVASALNSWAVMGAERGKVTESDMDKTFTTVFGVQFNEAIAAFKQLSAGDTSGARDLNQRSAAALGLKPEQSEAFIKGMYRNALAKWGYDVDQIKW
ncbi:MAG: hypothetical protein ACXWQQ_08750 [Pseudobdellovibrio sp.]